MDNYLSLIKDCLTNGVLREDRTGIGSRFLSGQTLRWDLSKGFPIVTARKTPLRFAFEETMLFLRGQTDTTILENKNINIWKGNTSREFLDNRGLSNLPVGSLGTGYSHQWRNFGGNLNEPNGVDQVKIMLANMKSNPNDRRHIISAWNPTQLAGTPLPPCHLMHMYTIDKENKKLNSCFIMRSSDLYHGLPFNICGYALLNHIFAKYLNLEPGELVYFGWDAHIYKTHESACNEMIGRTPKALPTLSIAKDLNSFEDVLSLEFSDIALDGYDPHESLIKVDMAI